MTVRGVVGFQGLKSLFREEVPFNRLIQNVAYDFFGLLLDFHINFNCFSRHAFHIVIDRRATTIQIVIVSVVFTI